MSRIRTLLNDGWYFTKTPINPQAPDLGSMEEVLLPHTWNALDGQDGGGDYYRGTCWYATEFDRPVFEDELWIEFGAVSQTAVVFVNGKEAGRHEGGFSRFRFNITALIQDGKNRMVVAADNSENDRTYPQHADFTFYGGIYREVALISVAQRHFDLDFYASSGVAVTYALAENGQAQVAIKTYAKGVSGCFFRFTVLDAEGRVIARETGTSHSFCFHIGTPRLWNGTNDPYLYNERTDLPKLQSSFHLLLGHRQ